MERLLYWSDCRTLYFIVAYGGALGLFTLASWPAISGKRNVPIIRTVCYLGLVYLWIFLTRWPSLFHFVGFSIDEDQFLSAARTLIDDPVFFRSTEAGSSGPLNIYPLLLPIAVGQIPTLFSGRVVGLLMIFGSMTMLHLYLRMFLSESLTRVLILFTAVFFGLTSFWDFLHYTSELTPAFIVSVGVVLVARAIIVTPQSKASWMFYSATAAAVLSLVPFAKLQATYLALGIGFILLIATVLQKQFGWHERLKCLFMIIIGSMFFPTLLVAGMIHYGVFNYFVKSYIMNSLAYVESGHAMSWINLLMRIIGKAPEFQVLLYGWGAAVTVTGFGIIMVPGAKLPTKLMAGFVFAAALLLLVGYTIAAPKRDWPHYLMFSPIVLAIFLGTIVGGLEDRLNSASCLPTIRKKTELLLCLLLLGFCCLPFLGYRLVFPNPFLGTAKIWNDLQKEPFSPIGKSIVKAANGTNRKLAVWGYNPNYYTETGLKQATRLSISSAQFNDNSLKDFFRQTYLEDLQRNLPGVFVDATAANQFPALNDPERFRHEIVPGISNFVDENYELMENIEGVRIYRLISKSTK